MRNAGADGRTDRLVSWILFGLGAAVCKASKSLLQKRAAGATDDYTTGLATRIVPVPVFIAAILLFPEMADVQGLADPTVAGALIAEIAILTATSIILTRAFRLGDASRVGPMLSLIPVGVIPTSFLFLNESPSPLAGVGVVLVAVGGYALTLDHGNGWREPVSYVYKSRPGRLVMVVVLLASIVPVFDKVGATASSPVAWGAALHVGTSLTLAVVWLVVRPEMPDGKNLKWLLAVGMASGSIWVFQLYGYVETNVAYVYAIKRASILVTVVGGGLLFGEVEWRRRFPAAVVMAVGAILIGLGA